MAIHKLTPRKVATAGPGKHGDGGGLWLVVSRTGAKKWVLRFTLHGRRREMGLGGYPTVGLRAAREAAREARAQARQGINPITERKVQQPPTFTSCAARYILAHRRGWRNTKHARQWVSTLKTFARPTLGNKRVEEITTEDVLAVLKPIWHTRPETAKRVQGRIENILDFAAARRWRDPLNPARWRGHLDKLLPRPARQARHHPAMPWCEVPGFMAELPDSIAGLALRFLILTAARTSEVLQARWDEFDLEAGVWTVPAERMKARREHRVPLSGAALDVLSALPRITGNPHVFPGAKRGRPLSGMALLQVMRRLGYGVNGTRGDYVPHGFRSAFRDWAAETTAFPREVVEMALAHTIENKVEAAYRRGDLLDKRRGLMQQWARFLMRPAAKVVALPR